MPCIVVILLILISIFVVVLIKVATSEADFTQLSDNVKQTLTNEQNFTNETNYTNDTFNDNYYYNNFDNQIIKYCSNCLLRFILM